MAKVTGPLMSLSASGSLAKTITFSIWKGRPYVRELVKPSNPSTEGQQTIRVKLGAIAKAAKAVLTSYKDVMHVGSQFFQAARDGAPSGQSWISFLQKEAIGTYTAMFAAWTALAGGDKTFFQTAGESIGLTDYEPIYSTDTANSAGVQLFMLAYFAYYTLGLTSLFADFTNPTESEVNDFADIVHLTS